MNLLSRTCQRGVLPLLTVFVLVGCGSTTDSAPREQHGFDPDACTDFTVPNRLGFRWREINHRVSIWSIGGQPSPSECRTEAVDARFVGGPFSTGEGTGIEDVPILEYGYQRVRRDSPRRVGAARHRISTQIGPEGTARGVVVLQRSELDLEGYPTVVALIGGLGFRTGIEQRPAYPDDYEAEKGYTLAGLGAGVRVLVQTDEQIVLTYRLRFEPGAAADREPLNRAQKVARIGARLDVLLVGVDGVPVRRGESTYRLQYGKPEVGEEQEIPHASEDKQHLGLEGKSERPRGFWGFQSIDFDLRADTSCSGDQNCPSGDTCGADGTCQLTFGEPGYYIRELSVGASLDDYRRSSGDADFSVDGYASNASRLVAFYALRHRFSGRIAWFQASGAGQQRTLERELDIEGERIQLE